MSASANVTQLLAQLNDVTEDICVKAMQNDWDDMDALCDFQFSLIQTLFSDQRQHLDADAVVQIKNVQSRVNDVMHHAKEVREGIFAELQKMKKNSLAERQYIQNSQ